ncbi:NADH-quinone oxidoreductase, E subunit [Granulicella mallensis MP5ACTX8]|uniref:NADH-quinone oxidoreductase, E subunit n=2 Tax=Granulicella mallensis TaxID=940614 RepID=G8P017_GRAMM|nr:NADH-quinone oxidoreductase, E subunit [Granulicella mallensis MP5ACTX8]
MSPLQNQIPYGDDNQKGEDQKSLLLLFFLSSPQGICFTRTTEDARNHMAAIANTIFSPETAARFDKLATIYPVKRSALIPMLLYAQDEVGYVSDEVVAELAKRLDLLELDVRNVLSYYSMLRTKPAGKYNVQVCTNISCMLRGGFELLDHCKHTLGIGHKGVTPDGLFSLEEVECIGACCWAPAVQVNYDFHDDLTPAKMDAVLADYREGRGKDVK